MKIFGLLSILLSSQFLACATTNSGKLSSDDRVELKKAVESDSRTNRHMARDIYRNPQKTLEFFGIKPGMTVVEIWPGSGYYAEILAPYLKVEGRYIAAGFNSESEVSYYRNGSQKFKDLVASRSDDFGSRVTINDFEPPVKNQIAEPNSVDAVLTFRNVHNWMGRDGLDAAFEAFYTALKPGGVLGVVEHRASSEKAQDPKAKSGYVREDFVIEVAKKAGFKLEASSEVNANPKDVRDYPKGVWTLPPSLALRDEDRQKYVAIGESDRMTLKFVKPKS
ncbi:class I SAM-dependent methyltransferase [Pseudobacteriovorax antillogorgiicola]|uniref:Predicted methyltransferase n=1 Tax=Pseudobacteriovorax antillogorgiicola TaxID=1513793 RepID=A0A1Y6BAA3_9BACT|nr:class I SAM-dependent methyltransferase [Pseudobacteriovorax antillogorgiicola]TCS57437.1 putative methyltransferase [Pseudobacteriovorax antillogorgiicola]SMF01074.1 Predicted methyltransferase [Pseudobacteriovorax antillogorgiicola]